ncbi:phage tail protein I [Rhizobium sp. AN73]|uniref:phage tail protein I n=1 Tax=Rhizobium sp. AN73 TaxID=3035124 RepID=UPI0027426969|nr:phage tail protein I [Rhizobium sp. AN73]
MSEAFEKALIAGMTDDLPIPYDVIMDPYRTPARFLPWLAAHHSVDLWYDDWSEERKREMIAQCAGLSTDYPASPLAALKGTLVGLKRYLAFVDADIIDRIAHPARFTFGRAVIGRTPIAHQPFTAHYLVHVTLRAPKTISRSADLLSAVPLSHPSILSRSAAPAEPWSPPRRRTPSTPSPSHGVDPSPCRTPS